MGLILSGWFPGVYTDSELVRRYSGGVFLDPLHCAADAVNVLVSEQAVLSMEEAVSVRLSPAGVQSVSLGSLASSGDPQEDFPPLSTHGQSTSAVHRERRRSHCALASQARCGRGEKFGTQRSRHTPQEFGAFLA